ncbi:MAG: hypothetical protein WAN28_15160 [Terracidiphilus sp.]
MSCGVRFEKHGPVAARLETLDYHGIASSLLKPLCFFYTRRRRENPNAPLLEPGHQIGSWQSEVKADDRRVDLLYNVTHLFVERKPEAAFCHSFDVETQPFVM